jgi:FAD/FMN-containing dehydrogenase
MFPLTLASQGSARIGGLLATNAGGVNVIRYGNARDLTAGDRGGVARRVGDAHRFRRSGRTTWAMTCGIC